MDEFTGQNLNNLLAFLNRVQLSGEEAVAMVELQQKIRLEMTRRTALKTADPPADPSGTGQTKPAKKAAPKKAATKKPH